MNNRKEYLKEYYLKNKKKINLRNNDWYSKNKKHVATRTKLYYHEFPWIKTFLRVQNRCRNLKNKVYGGKGIKCLLTLEQVQFIWFRDKAYEMNRPSIDRKDSNGHYEFSNCQFLELNKNCVKRNKEPNQKKVLQYSLDNKLVKEWNSITEIEKFLKVGRNSLYQCLSNRYNNTNQYKGFIWRYK